MGGGVSQPVLDSKDSTAIQLRSDFESLPGLVNHLTDSVLTAALSQDDDLLSQVTILREALQAAATAESQIAARLTSILPKPRQHKRAGYLRSLTEIIGPRPTRSWKDEWAGMLYELKQLNGELLQREDRSWVAARDFCWGSGQLQAGDVVDEDWINEHEAPEILSDVNSKRWIAESISRAKEVGWEEEDAMILNLLLIPRKPLSLSLQRGDPCYAAAIYALCDVLSRKCHEQEQSQKAPSTLYRTLYGPASLSDVDPTWKQIEVPDATGFCGLCSLATVRGDADPRRFKKEGMTVWTIESQSYEVIDSPIVAFVSEGEDEQGFHAAVAMERSDRSHDEYEGVFPPNCLFRLQRVEKGGFKAPGGIWVEQKLLVVTATFRSPLPLDIRNGSAASERKMCGGMNTLSYGDRGVFVNGFNALLSGEPLLTMSMEFERDFEWTDWCGVTYDLQKEWKYVNGTAMVLEGCTAGTRDLKNDGVTLEEFCGKMRDFIIQRRKDGWGLRLDAENAFLSLEEILAVRLYSGPCFQPINTFLRQIAGCSERYRLALARHPMYTFAATCKHLYNAVRKLSAVATKEESCTRLYRGVRGELKPSFWTPDEQGIICAVDVAFMSCSRQRATTISYMSPGLSNNVLWEVQPSSESDAAFHYGADISLLSQFAEESEVLFPPCTMLVVKTTSSEEWRAPSDLVEENGRHFCKVQVKPSFV